MDLELRTTFVGPVATGSLLCEDNSTSVTGLGLRELRTLHFAEVVCRKLHDCFCFLSIWPHRPFTKNSAGKYNVSRTFIYHPDRMTDTFHFITHGLNIVIDLCYFVVDTMGEHQELCRCHSNFLLCQFIQSLESILNLRISQQLP